MARQIPISRGRTLQPLLYFILHKPFLNFKCLLIISITITLVLISISLLTKDHDFNDWKGVRQKDLFDYSMVEDLPKDIRDEIIKKKNTKLKSRSLESKNKDLKTGYNQNKKYIDIRKRILEKLDDVNSFMPMKKDSSKNLQNIQGLGSLGNKHDVLIDSEGRNIVDDKFVVNENIKKTNIEVIKNEKKEIKESGSLNNLPTCHIIPLHLIGRQKVQTSATEGEVLSLMMVRNVTSGGRWAPQHCHERYSVAIIVPYRGREKQIWTFLHHIHPFLQRQELNYSIYIVEQDGNELFNRAKLLNIGFVEALKDQSFDCVIFHDVDMLPEDDRHLYHCSAMPRHLVVASSNNKYKSALSFQRERYYGGACMMLPRHVRKVNGWSNRYWGWGGEDDDMWRRVAVHDIPVWRYPAALARYTMLTHGPPSGINRKSYATLARLTPFHKADGLNSLRYSIMKTSRLPHHTRIIADIGGPKDDPVPEDDRYKTNTLH